MSRITHGGPVLEWNGFMIFYYFVFQCSLNLIFTVVVGDAWIIWKFGEKIQGQFIVLQLNYKIAIWGSIS